MTILLPDWFNPSAHEVTGFMGVALMIRRRNPDPIISCVYSLGDHGARCDVVRMSDLRRNRKPSRRKVAR